MGCFLPFVALFGATRRIFNLAARHDQHEARGRVGGSRHVQGQVVVAQLLGHFAAGFAGIASAAGVTPSRLALPVIAVLVPVQVAAMAVAVRAPPAAAVRNG